MSNKIIELKGITKTFDDQQVLKGIDLNIYENEFLTLLGPSGCGKTTLLRILGGFESADNGEVLFNGKDIAKVPPYKREINTVFQKYALFPFLNVYDNVAFGLNLKKMDKDVIDKKVKNILALVGLEGFEKRDVTRLSGGQQQRCAIARAMVKKPDILLCDELTGALDTKSSKDVLKRVQSMNDTYKTTVVIITHNLNIAGMADRIIKITDGKVVSNTKNTDKKRVEEMEL